MGTLHPRAAHPPTQPTADQKRLGERIPEHSEKAKYDSLLAGNYLRSICTELGIISNLEII